MEENNCDNCKFGHNGNYAVCPFLNKCINSTEGYSVPTYWEALFTENKTVDMVNHPSHYKAKNGMEAIDVIKAFTDGLVGSEAYNTGNAIKYILRWKNKNGVEDLKKAVWYINDLINELEKEK